MCGHSPLEIPCFTDMCLNTTLENTEKEDLNSLLGDTESRGNTRDTQTGLRRG